MPTFGINSGTIAQEGLASYDRGMAAHTASQREKRAADLDRENLRGLGIRNANAISQEQRTQELHPGELEQQTLINLYRSGVITQQQFENASLARKDRRERDNSALMDDEFRLGIRAETAESRRVVDTVDSQIARDNSDNNTAIDTNSVKLGENEAKRYEQTQSKLARPEKEVLAQYAEEAARHDAVIAKMTRKYKGRQELAEADTEYRDAMEELGYVLYRAARQSDTLGAQVYNENDAYDTNDTDPAARVVVENGRITAYDEAGNVINDPDGNPFDFNDIYADRFDADRAGKDKSAAKGVTPKQSSPTEVALAKDRFSKSVGTAAMEYIANRDGLIEDDIAQGDEYAEQRQEVNRLKALAAAMDPSQLTPIQAVQRAAEADLFNRQAGAGVEQAFLDLAGKVDVKSLTPAQKNKLKAVKKDVAEMDFQNLTPDDAIWEALLDEARGLLKEIGMPMAKFEEEYQFELSQVPPGVKPPSRMEILQHQYNYWKNYTPEFKGIQPRGQ